LHFAGLPGGYLQESNPNPPEMMKKNLFVTMMMSVGLLAIADAQEAGAKLELKPAAEAGGEAEPKDLAKLLKDQLIAVDGDKVAEAKFEDGMDYYLVYHSASW
jgi:hypothetical protein